MHVMLTGSPPFYGQTKDETIAKIKEGEINYKRI